MYSGSIEKAIQAKLLTISELTDQLKIKTKPTDDLHTSFINRRKLIAFNYLCQKAPDLALNLCRSNINNKDLLSQIWRSYQASETNPIGPNIKLAKIITGQYNPNELETELLTYYVEAGNDLTKTKPNLMILETCVDVDRIIDIIRYLPTLNLYQLRIVIMRMLNRFSIMKERYFKYWYRCMYISYQDFFRRFVAQPESLTFTEIQQLQNLTNNDFLGVTDLDHYQVLLYRCNQRTITRILGLKIDSDIFSIKMALNLMREIGANEYFERLYNYHKSQLPEFKNTVDLHFVNFWEYHPDDLIVIDDYMFTGPEFNNLLTTMKNPYTRQEISSDKLIEIRMKIPQPTETPKELFVKYTH